MRRGYVTTIHAERLAECTNQYIHAAQFEPDVFFGSAAGWTKRTHAVGIIHDQNDVFLETIVVLATYFDDLIERGMIASHRKNTIRDNDRALGVTGCFLQLGIQSLYIVVLV